VFVSCVAGAGLFDLSPKLERDQFLSTCCQTGSQLVAFNMLLRLVGGVDVPYVAACLRAAAYKYVTG